MNPQTKGAVVRTESDTHAAKGQDHSTPRPALPATADSAGLMAIINRAATDQTFDVAKLEQLLAVRDRWEANEARKAYNEAFTAFKGEAIKLLRDTPVTDGPLKGKKYASKFAVVNAVTEHLSAHGLSASWKLTKDEKEWIEVTCTLRHTLGHSEAVSMGGAPDTGPGRNAIQARSSTNSYLEKLTLKAICGIAEQGDDNDGADGQADGLDEKLVADYLSSIDECADIPSLQKAFAAAYTLAQKAKDKPSMRKFTEAKDVKKKALGAKA